MDAIESLDWGAYFNFGHTVQKHPEILAVMAPAYYLSSSAGVVIIVILAVMLFLFQGKVRAALASIFCFALAIGLIETMRHLVPRHRPEDADLWLGPDQMLGSYPCAGVMLFMLSAHLFVAALWNLLPGPRWRGFFTLVAALLTIWVCLANLMLRIHWVTDVIGALAGAALFIWLAYRLMGTNPPALAAQTEPTS